MTTAQTEARASLWAPATADQSVSGWTYDFDQIERISRAAYNGTGYDATMEVVQFVMAEADRRYTTALAAKDAEIAALKKEASKFAEWVQDYSNDGPDEVLSLGNPARSSEFSIFIEPHGKYWGSDRAGSGFMFGPGFKAYAGDFPGRSALSSGKEG